MAREHELTTTAGCVSVVLLGPLLLWHGFMLAQLWNWFAAPLFHLPLVNVAQAIGVALVLSMLKGYKSPEHFESPETGKQIVALLGPTIYYSIYYLVGIVAHRYV